MNNIVIRPEREEDYYEAEYMTKKAFWNLHVPGCNEHYLVHLLRDSKDYIRELSRVAVIDNKIVGGIYYSKAFVMDGEKKTEVLSFGPLCVDPQYQNTGIGGRLLEETIELARKKNYWGIIIYGEPGYYPKHGFKTCDQFHITTLDGKNFDVFMGYELHPERKEQIKGKFYEAEVFEQLDAELVEKYDKGFPYMEKLKLPGQWE